MKGLVPSVPLTSNEALALQCLGFWWGVVVYKHSVGAPCGEIDPETGAPGTRVSASECCSWVLEHTGAHLSEKQARTSLEGLVEKGVVTRAQRWKHICNRSFTYFAALPHHIEFLNPEQVGVSTPPTPSSLPAPVRQSRSSTASTTQARTPKPDMVVVESVTHQGSDLERRPSPEVSTKFPAGKIKSKYFFFSISDKTKATPSLTAGKTEIDRERQPEQPVSHQPAVSAPEGPQEDRGEACNRPEVGTPTQTPQTPLGSSVVTPGRIGHIQVPPVSPEQHRGSPSIMDRCLRRGGYSSVDEWVPPAPVSPRAIIRRDGIRLEVDDGATAPLR